MTQSKSLQRIGSYADDDAIFLLKDISNIIVESSTNQREMAIQSGTHYSEMLPIEYKPSKEYMDLFFTSLQQYKHKLAVAAGVVAEQIVKTKGTNLVLVSLARAGTPIGVLIKRYIRYQYNLDLPHYSMSIIRGRGIDENALQYILQKHPNQTIQFIDGWTGKGAIKKSFVNLCIDLTKSIMSTFQTVWLCLRTLVIALLFMGRVKIFSFQAPV